jgi:NADH-quinone oxidoreductase subunit N
MKFFFDIDWFAFLPEFFIIFSLFFLLIYSSFFSTSFRHNFPILIKNLSWLALQSFFFVIFLLLNNVFESAIIFNNFLIVDFFSTFIKLVVISLNSILLLIVVSYNKKEKLNNFEFTILNIFSCIGIFFLVSSYDLISVFLSLELQSFSFYILCCFKRQSEFSIESGLKYFILGAFSSGFFLFGCSFMYGFSGTTNFEKLFIFFNSFCCDFFSSNLVCFTSLFFIFIGLMFKLGVSPFHMWSPDVFEGSPLSVTSFFSIVPKIGIFSLFLRLVVMLCYGFFLPYQEFILFCSFISIFIGIFGALFQKKIKRFLVYSSISHFGFIFLGISSNSNEGVFSSLFYILIYTFTMVLIFSLLLTIRLKKTSQKIKFLTDLSSLFQTHSFLAVCFLVIFFSMGGIPPFCGFFTKFFIFFSSFNSDIFLISFFSILLGGVGGFYYVRLIKIMFFETNNLNFVFTHFKKENSIISSFFSFFLAFFLFFPNLIIILIYNSFLNLFI